ncbi:MAG: hypothetical protein KY455_05670 [Euryarchaeota archaeon]|nr:hypothetical protein [Euryarchaeota archaeon]
MQRKTLAFLVLITLAAFALFWFHAGLEDLWLNLGTEMVGIMVTVLLVERGVRKAQEAQRQRIARLGLAELKVPLRTHFGLLASMAKAASTEITPKNRTRGDVFDLFQTVARFFDFDGPAPVFPEESWFEYIEEPMLEIRQAIDATIGKYASVLSEDELIALEDLRRSNLIDFLQNAAKIPRVASMKEIDYPRNLLAHESWKPMIKEHCRALDRALALFERLEIETFRFPDVLLTEKISPKWASSRRNPDEDPWPLETSEGPSETYAT